MIRKKTVRWTMPPGEDGSVQFWEFDVETVTVRRQGFRQGMVAEASEWFAKEGYGELTSALGNAGDDNFDLAYALAEWTVIIASITAYRYGVVRQENAEIESSALPDDWRNPGWFVDNVPGELADALARASHTVNPDIFRVRTGEEAKNAGGVSVF